MESDIWMRKGTQALHAIWVLRADIKSVEQQGLLNLLRASATALEADFACVHLLTPSEVARGRENETVLPLDRKGTKFTFMIGGDDLQRRIPELYWATVFGPPYLEMFGRECLLSAPVFKAEALGTNAVCLQLSPELRDLISRSSELERIRSTVKKHLGVDAFFQADRNSSTSYQVPLFDLAPRR